MLASAPALAERMRALTDNVLYAPNVADTALFATRAGAGGPVDPGARRAAAPRVVFTGAVVATKLDFALLAALARARPDWTLALVGPGRRSGDPRTDVSALERAAEHPPARRAATRELPAVLRGGRRGDHPLCVDQLTRASSR